MLKITKPNNIFSLKYFLSKRLFTYGLIYSLALLVIICFQVVTNNQTTQLLKEAYPLAANLAYKRFLIDDSYILAESKKDTELTFELSNNVIPYYQDLKKALNKAISENKVWIAVLQARINTLQIISLIIASLILSLSMIFGLFVIRQLIKLVVNPIEHLTEEMPSVVSGKIKITTTHGQLSEINSLIQSIEQMLAHRAHYEQELVINQRSLKYLVYHDLSTGVYNYQFFLKTLKSSLLTNIQKSNNNCIVVFATYIHNFHALVRLLGKGSADQLLHDFATQIKNIGRQDITLARIESNCFVGCFNFTNCEEVSLYIEKSIKQLSAKIFSNKLELPIDFTTGYVCYPENHGSAVELIHFAQYAATQAKIESTELHKQINKNDLIAIKRNNTLEKDSYNIMKNNEVVFLYQPQYEIKSKKLIGCEVLVRWHHPKYGEISPIEFIPILEKTQQIINFGQYLQEQVIKQFHIWKLKYKTPMKLAINASMLEITSSLYLKNLLNTINKYDINPECIEIEVTEGLVSQNYQIFESALKNLRRAGIKTAIDDFGTGYSSLERIRTIKVDLLKIDKVFMKSLGQSTEAQNLLKSMLDLAKSISLPTLVEGVETKEQAVIAESIGCQYAQGFYYNKPLTAQQIEEILDKIKNIDEPHFHKPRKSSRPS